MDIKKRLETTELAWIMPPITQLEQKRVWYRTDSRKSSIETHNTGRFQRWLPECLKPLTEEIKLETFDA